MEPITFAAGMAVGAVGGTWALGVIYAVHIKVADWKLTTAQAVRSQSAEMLAQAQHDAVIAHALTTDTAEYAVIQPSVRVRVGAALTDLREWAAGLGPDTSPAWAPGEVLALAERPPLRKRGQLHASRRSWPMVELLPAPTPLEVAQRLAALYDPSRELRVIKVRTF